MPKDATLTRVTGLVALSYLVLIPAAGYLIYRRLQDLQSDVDELWRNNCDSEPPERTSFIPKYWFK